MNGPIGFDRIPAMDTAAGEQREALEQKTFLVVLRAPSSARFAPEEGQEIFLPDVPGIAGTVRLRLRTRWVDESFEAPTPRELWIEALGPAPSLDDAVSKFSAAGRFLATLLAFCANATVGTAEVHIAYDASPGSNEREFMEVFLPDERGLPREGRLARTSEFSEVFKKLDESDEKVRINRALQQYELALRYWYFGGEWLALSHLYMAVEALTKAAIRRECASRGIDEPTLARQNSIDPGDEKCPTCLKRSRWRDALNAWRRQASICPNCLKRSRWRDALNAWCREVIIFEGDREIYQAAKRASDGVEHGFMDLSEVYRRSMIATDATFGYVRRTILRLLNISHADFPELVERVPRDVQSLRKILRGHFVGPGDDPAPPGEEYPYLEWRSAVRTLTRDGDKFSLSFQEKVTVRCASGYGFRGTGFGVRAREEPGQEPIRLEAVVDVSVNPETDASPTDALNLMTRATKFASNTAALGRTSGMPSLKTIAFGLLSEQVAIFEAIETLLRADRPVEALILLRSLIIGGCRLESILIDRDNSDGAALRLKLDAIDRVMTLYANDSDFVEHLQGTANNYRRKATDAGISIPDTAPNIKDTPLYREHADMLRFAEEAARGDDLAVAMHTKKDDEGTLGIHTKVVDAKLARGIAGMSVLALTASTIAFATTLDWPYRENVAAELQREGTRLTDESN
jgi:hypothetical protein